jgi:hypothetical protein
MSVSTEFSDTGYRYQLILRGECGPLVAGLFGDVTIESGHGRTSMIFSVRDDSELYGMLDRIQDLGLHLVSLNELGSTAAGTPRVITWIRKGLTVKRQIRSP